MNGDSTNSNLQKGEPEFIYLLNEQDKLAYEDLRKSYAESLYSKSRNNSTNHFQELLNSIKKYAQRETPDDWKRCLVCGVVFLNNRLAINNHQLKFLYGKCKSSINGVLNKIGWETHDTRGDLDPELVAFFPLFRKNVAKLRQWSIRIQNTKAIQANSSKSTNVIHELDVQHSPQHVEQMTNLSLISLSSLPPVSTFNEKKPTIHHLNSYKTPIISHNKVQIPSFSEIIPPKTLKPTQELQNLHEENPETVICPLCKSHVNRSALNMTDIEILVRASQILTKYFGH